MAMTQDRAGIRTQLPWDKLVPAGNLHPNPDQPRDDFGDLAGLAESIRVSGLEYPVLVQPAPGGYRCPDCEAVLDAGHDYWIEDGERRWRAITGASLMSAIPSIIRPLLPGENPVMRNLTTALVTDVHRRSLNAIERAKALGRLRDEMASRQERPVTQEQIGRQVGIDSTTVSTLLTLLELAPQTQQMVIDGKLTVTEAIRLVRRKRARDRRKKGQAPAGAQWEPDYFTRGNPQWKAATVMCDARGHSSRRRYGEACGQCWTDAARADERKITEATAREAAAWRELQGRQELAKLRDMIDENISDGKVNAELARRLVTRAYELGCSGPPAEGFTGAGQP